MSLNYVLAGIKDFKELTITDAQGGVKLKPTTHALVFMTMFVEMGEITEHNTEEFFTRAYIHEKCFGALNVKSVGDKMEDASLTYQDVIRHIGLKTNVSTKPKAHFNAEIARKLRNEAREKLTQEKADVEKAKTETNRGIPSL